MLDVRAPAESLGNAGRSHKRSMHKLDLQAASRIATGLIERLAWLGT